VPNKTARAIDKTIRNNLGKLSKPGVLTVRPGFEIAGHQLTGKPAIVATVHTKKKNLPKQALLPNSVAGIPVDVREARPFQRLCAHDWPAAAVTQVFARPEDKEPTWPFERQVPSGKLLQNIWSMSLKALEKTTASQPAMQKVLVTNAKKKQLQYVPAKNTPLTPVTTTTTITAVVSPDAGFTTLEDFLAGAKKSLVIGMYDFTSASILSDFKSDLGSPRTLQMVLDNPILNPTADQSDSQTVADLKASLGSRAKIAWALDRSNKLVSVWMFPFAYHIKVIVRDGTSFWLSSGNLNNSNEPNPAHPPSHEDRDWHVIIEDPQLVGTFLAYLNQDFTSAAANQNPAPPAVLDALAVATAKLALDTNPPPPPSPNANAKQAVPAKTFKDIPVTITPVLTPDTLPNSKTGQYLSTMTKFISSAKKSLYVQLQYIEASKGSGFYEDLLQTIADRVKAGVDVRLIEDQTNGEKWAEKMKDSGVDLTANIRLQPSPSVHNKGFVIDSSIVVVSSQNFSPAGVHDNRDAGVIIESPEIAQYFEPVFLSDWNRLKPFAPKAAKPTPAPAASKTSKPALAKSAKIKPNSTKTQ
jgi:phosphatidylserine/phosphatidylglycerophosphate/cardiolipin synthase-like enzyme